MTYMPVGGAAETIEWYDEKCAAAGRGVIARWYCNMAEQLRKTVGALHPPPLPEPPPFVGRKIPPAEVTEGSAYEQWFAQQQQKSKSNRKLMLFGALGIGAFLLMRRKR